MASSEEGREEISTTAKQADGANKFSVKLLAVVIAAAILGASGFYVWYEYYRHWGVEDLDEAIILVDERGPFIKGFKTYLAGRTVTVEADISHLSTVQTTLGELNILRLEGARYVGLMQWGSVDYEVGDRVVIDVSFERAVINGIEGVFSPQATLGLGTLEQMQVINQAISWVRSEYLIEVEDLGDDVVVRIDKVSEPFPLDTSNCSVKAGANLGMMEYVDLLGFYPYAPFLDTISDLSVSEGENGTIMFSDANEDGYFDDGDAFTLRNLTRPETECGAQTYLLWVERELFPGEPDLDLPPGVFYAYLVMTHNGVLWVTSDSAPVAKSFLTPVDDGVSVTIEYARGSVPWNDTELLLSDGMDFVRWAANETMLASGLGASCSCGVKDVGDVSLECFVTDVQGDGRVGAGDRIDLLPRNGTSLEGENAFTISLMYKPTGNRMAWESFVYGAAPTSECSVVAEDTSCRATFVPVHNGTERDYMQMDVMWDEVVVTIDDGTNMTEWKLNSSNLDSGEQAIWTSSDTALGTLTLRCTAFDLQGNGLVNSGDMMAITVTSANGFDSDTVYTVAIRYLPTDTDLFSFTFDG